MKKFCKVLVVFNEAVEAYCRKAVEMDIPLDYGVWNGKLMWLDDKLEPHVVCLDMVHHIECEDAVSIYPDLVKSVSPTKVYDHFLDKDDPDYYDDNVIDRMYEGCADPKGRTLSLLDLLRD